MFVLQHSTRPSPQTRINKEEEKGIKSNFIVS